MLSERFFKEHGDFNFNIVPAVGMTLSRVVRTLTKNGGEDIVEIFGVVALIFSLLELTVELWVVAVLPQLVVLGASLLITQYFPGFSNLFKPGLRVSLFTDIRMVFTGESTIGGLDCLEIVCRFHAHNGVIIL